MKITKGNLIGIVFKNGGTEYVIRADKYDNTRCRVFDNKYPTGKGGDWTKEEVYQRLKENVWKAIKLPIDNYEMY